MTRGGRGGGDNSAVMVVYMRGELEDVGHPFFLTSFRTRHAAACRAQSPEEIRVSVCGGGGRRGVASKLPKTMKPKPETLGSMCSTVMSPPPSNRQG